MPKRKRENDTSDAEDQPRAKLSVRQKRVRFKIDGGTKSLAKAFKLAKGFERQKLGRRMKTAHAENNQKDVSRIDEEIKALKALEPTRPAQLHLFKSLMRIKAVAQHPNLPDEVRPPGTLATDKATLNINARLCNSNPVQQSLKEVLKDIQLALGVDVESAEAGKKQRVRAKDLQNKEKLNVAGKKTEKVDKNSRPEEIVEDGLTSGDDVPQNLNKATLVAVDEADSDDDGALDDDDLAQYDDRLASSDVEDEDADADPDPDDIVNDHNGRDESKEVVEDDDDDDGDIEALEARLASEGVKASKAKTKHNPAPSTTKPKQPTPYSLEDDLSMSAEDDSDNDSATPEPRKAAFAPAPPPTTKSSFIPSLTLGGYMSGSGSDVDDDWDAGPSSAQASRKNRRGQRARQAIWEKKFGTKANHLSKSDARDGKRGSADRGAGRDSGWDAKRGATDGRERRGGAGFRGGKSGSRAGGYGRGGHSTANGAARGGHENSRSGAVKQKSRDDSGPIHPSWEAAKRAKEKKEAPVVFAGKKITFD